MGDFHLMEIKVKDGYPDMKHLRFMDSEEVVQHFIKRLYREVPREDWEELHDILLGWSLNAKLMESVLPEVKWVINLGGDKVRAPEIEKDKNSE